MAKETTMNRSSAGLSIKILSTLYLLRYHPHRQKPKYEVANTPAPKKKVCFIPFPISSNVSSLCRNAAISKDGSIWEAYKKAMGKERHPLLKMDARTIILASQYIISNAVLFFISDTNIAIIYKNKSAHFALYPCVQWLTRAFDNFRGGFDGNIFE